MLLLVPLLSARSRWARHAAWRGSRRAEGKPEHSLCRPVAVNAEGKRMLDPDRLARPPQQPTEMGHRPGRMNVLRVLRECRGVLVNQP